MTKRTISAINCFLTVFVFLCVFGNVCFRSAFPGKGGSDFPQRIAFLIYFAISIVFSIFCICNYPYYSNRLLLATAIYNALLPALLILAALFFLIFPKLGYLDIESLDFFDWVIMILPPVISGLYFWAAFKKK